MTEGKRGRAVDKGTPGSGEKIMTEQQFLVLVHLLKGDVETPANRAAKRVLVDGITKPAAVAETGATRSTVHDATTRYFKAFKAIEEAWPNAVTVAMEMANSARQANKVTAKKAVAKKAN